MTESTLLEDQFSAERARQAVSFLMRLVLTTLVATVATATVLVYVLAW